jgi:hypothetical protein
MKFNGAEQQYFENVSNNISKKKKKKKKIFKKQTKPPIFLHILFLFLVDKETVSMKTPLNLPFALLDAPTSHTVHLKLVDSLSLVLDTAQMSVPQLKQMVLSRRALTLDRAAISVSLGRQSNVDRFVSSPISSWDSPQGARIAYRSFAGHGNARPPLRVVVHEFAGSGKVSGPVVSVVFRQVGIAEQRARSDVVDKATLPQLSRQFAFALNPYAAARGPVLPGTISIEIVKHGLLSDELYGRLELRLEEIAEKALARADVDAPLSPAAAAALHQPAAGALSHVKWHNTNGSRIIKRLLVQVIFPPDSLVAPPPPADPNAAPARAAPAPPLPVDDARSSTSSMKSAGDDDDVDDFEMSPAQVIPKLRELSAFARAFYESGGVTFEKDAEYEDKIKAEEEEDARRRAQLRRAERRLSASGAALINGGELRGDEKLLTSSSSLRLTVPQHSSHAAPIVRRETAPAVEHHHHHHQNADVQISVPSSASPSLRGSVAQSLTESGDFDVIPSSLPSSPGAALSSRSRSPSPSPDGRWKACAVCLEESENVDAYVTQDFCPHHVCIDCVLNAVVAAADSDRVACPVAGCAGSTSNRVLRQILPSDEFERRLDLELQATLKSVSADPSMRLVRCPAPGCDFVCETCDDTVVGDDNKDHDDDNDDDDDDDNDDDDTDDNDAVAKVSHVERFRQRHRFRCRKCFVDFCDRCRRTPYHDGHTCRSLVAFEAAPKCRFCGERVSPRTRDQVCTSDECRAKQRVACEHVHPCSHACGGLRFEQTHLPCLVDECEQGEAARAAAKVSQVSDDFCNICWVDPLCGAPTLQLGCGHLFHLACAQRRVQERWGNARVTFAFTGCPLCHVPMEHPALARMLRQVGKLREQIERMAMQRLVHEGLERDPDIVDGRFKGDPLGFAMARFAYYECFRCKLPYFGGQAVCAGGPGENEEGQFDPKLLVCGSCASGGAAAAGGETNCAVHGNDFIEYKCKFCCSVATWFCWGTTHLCSECHKTQGADFTGGPKMTRRPIAQLPAHFQFASAHGADHTKWPVLNKCPLAIASHPPNGTAELSLGCQLCRQVKEF